MFETIRREVNNQPIGTIGATFGIVGFIFDYFGISSRIIGTTDGEGFFPSFPLIIFLVKMIFIIFIISFIVRLFAKFGSTIHFIASCCVSFTITAAVYEKIHPIFATIGTEANVLVIWIFAITWPAVAVAVALVVSSVFTELQDVDIDIRDVFSGRKGSENTEKFSVLFGANSAVCGFSFFATMIYMVTK